MRDNPRTEMFKSSSLYIRLNCFLWLLSLFSRSNSNRKLGVYASRDWPGNTPPAATPDQLWLNVEAAWTAIPQGYIQSFFDSMPRRETVFIANNGGTTITADFAIIHTSQEAVILTLIFIQQVICKINFAVKFLSSFFVLHSVWSAV
ncbi:uncharacterized protein TNCV_3033081 [Trichonephila clavipes]|nr:uncharacterized protein TNCV_3033081 [Trichonephila clavipes]